MADTDGVPREDVIDEFADTAMDRLIHSIPGAMTGAAMTGLAKGMGMWVEPEEVAVIREAGEPPPDPEDPIQVSIDPDRPENTRIVYRIQAEAPDDGSATSG